MALWRVQHPDGSIHQYEGPTEKAAVDFANARLKTSAKKTEAPKTRTGQFIEGLKRGANDAARTVLPGMGFVQDMAGLAGKVLETDHDAEDYAAELPKVRARKAAAPKPGAFGAFTEATTQPVQDEIGGLLAGVGNEAWNVKRRLSGEAPVSSRAIYLANRDAENERADAVRAEHPFATGAGAIAGGLAMAPATGGRSLVAAGAPLARRAAPGLATRLFGKKASPLVAKGLGLLDAAPTAIGSGAAQGYAMGLAEGDNAEERRANAKEGAIGGALFGGGAHFGLPVLAKGAGVAGDIAGVVGAKTGASGFLDDLGAGAGKFTDDMVERLGLDRFNLMNLEDAMAPLMTGKPAPRAPGPLRPGETRPYVKEPLFGGSPSGPSAAQRAAIELAQKKGLTPAALRAKEAELEGLDPRLFDILGTEGEGIAKAVARRSGTSGDKIRDLIFERNLAQGGGVTDDFGDMLGVDPGAAAGDVDAFVARQKERGGPMIEAATQGEGGITSTNVERLLATKTGRELRAEMEDLFKESGDEAYGLTMGRVEVPDPRAGAHPNEAPPVGDEIIQPGDMPPDLGPAPQVKVPRGPAEEPSRGPSALTFLRNTGKGISSAMAGEAEQAGLRLGIKKGGAELHDMAERLWSAGYTPYLYSERQIEKLLNDGGMARLFAKEPDVDELMRFRARQAAEDQNRVQGTEHYGRQQDSNAAFRAEQARHAEETADFNRRMDEVGDDPADWRSLDEGTDEPVGGGTGANAPEYEPAYQEAMTPAATAKLLEYAGNRVDWIPGTRKPVNNPENLRRFLFWKQLSDEVAPREGGGLIPGLREAKDVYGEGLGAEKTLARNKGKLLQSSVREWGKLVSGARGKNWKPGQPDTAELAALKAAVANDYLEMAAAGNIGDRRLVTKATEGKLEVLFGKEGAAKFQARMRERRKLQISGNRVSPHSGSDTAGNLAAMEQVERLDGDTWARVGAKLQAGRPGAAIFDLLGSGVGKVMAEARTAGSSEAFRNELGDLLAMSPKQFAKVMEGFEGLDGSARKAVLAIVRGLGAGSLAGQGVANRQADRKEASVY